MPQKSHLLMMACYHQWAYDRLFKVANDVSETEYRKQLGLHFSSIHLTLNHLYLVDCLWYGRFSGTTVSFHSLDEELVKDRKDLEIAIMQQANRWVKLIMEFRSEFPKTLTFINLKGSKVSMSYIPTLTHAFNHGTHHRGQISAVLTQIGLPAPEMDLYYYLLETS